MGAVLARAARHRHRGPFRGVEGQQAAVVAGLRAGHGRVQRAGPRRVLPAPGRDVRHRDLLLLGPFLTPFFSIPPRTRRVAGSTLRAHAHRMPIAALAILSSNGVSESRPQALAARLAQAAAPDQRDRELRADRRAPTVQLGWHEHHLHLPALAGRGCVLSSLRHDFWTLGRFSRTASARARVRRVMVCAPLRALALGLLDADCCDPIRQS